MKRKQLEQCAWDQTPAKQRRDRVEHRVLPKRKGGRVVSEGRQRIRKLTGNSREILVFDPSGDTPGTMEPWMPLWALYNDELQQRCLQGRMPRMRAPYSRTRPDYTSSIEGDATPMVSGARMKKKISKKSVSQLNREIAEALTGKQAKSRFD